MKVKDVIISALHMLGRNDIADSLSKGSALDREATETVDTLLYCFNAVEDEVARKYLPLKCTDTVISIDGKYEYSIFLHSPVKILRVLVDGKDAEYELFPQYIYVNSRRITIEFEYAPSKKKIGDDSDFGAEVGETLLALGAAAEYCLINGEIERAELWEAKYKKEIDGTQKKLPSGGTIPPRRWV